MDFQRKPLHCPRCSRLLRKVHMRKLDHPSGAILDVCDSCGGMWLDKAEVMLIHQYRPAETKTVKKKTKRKKR